MECDNCKNSGQTETVYIGTSGKSLHSRQLEHMSEIRRRSNSNAPSKHTHNCHPGVAPSYNTTILAGGLRYNLDRYITEALRIEEAKDNKCESDKPEVRVGKLRYPKAWGHSE